MTQHTDTPAIQDIKILEAQWSDLPEDIYEEVVQLWRDRELGNDYYYYPFDVENEKYMGDDEDYTGEGYPKLVAYLEERGIKDILIHWWW